MEKRCQVYSLATLCCLVVCNLLIATCDHLLSPHRLRLSLALAVTVLMSLLALASSVQPLSSTSHLTEEGVDRFPLKAILEALETQYPFPEHELRKWQSLRSNLIEEASTVRTRSAFANAVQQAFQSLGISHLRLYDELYTNTDEIQARGRSHTGIRFQWIEDHWYVAGLQQTSGRTGISLEPGDEVTHLNGRRLPSVQQGASVQTLASTPLLNFGPNGDTWKIRARKPSGQSFEATGTYTTWYGRWSRSIGNLDSLPFEFDSRREGNIHILRFTAFVYDLLPEIRKALLELPDDVGLILDLRGNPGGMGLMANALAGLLTDHAFQLGTLNLKQGWIGFFADPQPGAFLGPVAILIDAFSASTSEIFALGLQEAGRARLFGQPSMGAALPSKWLKLEGNWSLQLPVATYLSAEGHTIEGTGVRPDTTIVTTREDLRNKRDATLEAAIHWIRSQLQSPQADNKVTPMPSVVPSMPIPQESFQSEA
ncbi:MAG: S41 family peptidase [Puniceicoccaceae bacterium]